MWEANAKMVEETYGVEVNWEERFYICPACGEPIYECDWTPNELVHAICPVCGFNEEDETDYDDCDYEVGYDPYMGCFTDDC